MNTIEYFKIESFSTVDGFGNRMVVFLNHCPYRCVYCHNPECWFKSKKKINVKKIIVEFEKTKEFYKNGGITLSGGEPLIQYDFCKELAKECKKRNINLCIDTSGYFFDKKKISKLLENDVFFLIDIKHTVKKWHKKITNKSNTNELKLINFLEQKKHKYWIRFVYAKKYTDQDINIKNIKKIISKLIFMERFEILPLHILAKEKYKSLGIKYKMNKENIPNSKEIENLKNFLDDKRVF